MTFKRFSPGFHSLIAALALIGVGLSATTADARVIVGLGFGFPFWYAPPPVVYAPAPYLYAPPVYARPVYVPPAPAAYAAPATQYWYYCDNPRGYYPYVRSCSQAWRPVAPTPPTVP